MVFHICAGSGFNFDHLPWTMVMPKCIKTGVDQRAVSPPRNDSLVSVIPPCFWAKTDQKRAIGVSLLQLHCYWWLHLPPPPPPLLAGWWSGWYWCVTNKNNLSTTMSHHTERYLNKCVASALFMGLQSLPSTLNRFPPSWAHPANSVRNPHLQVVHSSSHAKVKS